MKTATQEVIDLLAESKTAYYAELCTITLQDGTVFRTTSLDTDVVMSEG